MPMPKRELCAIALKRLEDGARTASDFEEVVKQWDHLDANRERNLYRQGIADFGGVAPTYRIELRERPTIVWDFNSLLLCVQMMFSFILTDENSSMKVCKHCGKAFVATRPNMEFDTPQCKNQYNVYKSRAKKNNNTDAE